MYTLYVYAKTLHFSLKLLHSRHKIFFRVMMPEKKLNRPIVFIGSCRVAAKQIRMHNTILIRE